MTPLGISFFVLIEATEFEFLCIFIFVFYFIKYFLLRCANMDLCFWLKIVTRLVFIRNLDFDLVDSTLY